MDPKYNTGKEVEEKNPYRGPEQDVRVQEKAWDSRYHGPPAPRVRDGKHQKEQGR